MSTALEIAPFTARELEIIKAAADGASAKVAGAQLGLSPDAINSRLQVARRIVGAKTTSALVATALRRGWIK